MLCHRCTASDVSTVTNASATGVEDLRVRVEMPGALDLAVGPCGYFDVVLTAQVPVATDGSVMHSNAVVVSVLGCDGAEVPVAELPSQINITVPLVNDQGIRPTCAFWNGTCAIDERGGRIVHREDLHCGRHRTCPAVAR